MWIKRLKRISRGQSIAFGTMDGVVNVMGVAAGIDVATSSKLAVIAGILAAGLANALANSSGFYVEEETAGFYPEKEIERNTAVAFLCSFGSALVISIPIFLLGLGWGVLIGAAIGILLLFLIGYFFAHKEKGQSIKIGLKYVVIGLGAMAICYLIGLFVEKLI
jgi:VIT1/CCC1 family predicted Fe2+/Mn2+ transporter